MKVIYKLNILKKRMEKKAVTLNNQIAISNLFFLIFF